MLKDSSDNEIYGYYCIAPSQTLKQIKPPRHMMLNIRLNNTKQYGCTRTKGQMPPAPIHGASPETCSLTAIVKQRVRKAKPKHTYFFEQAQEQNFAIEMQATRAWGRRRAGKTRKVFWHLSSFSPAVHDQLMGKQEVVLGADTKPPMDCRRISTARNKTRPRLKPSEVTDQTDISK